jgi:membrane-associated phospholipid phosphatase
MPVFLFFQLMLQITSDKRIFITVSLKTRIASFGFFAWATAIAFAQVYVGVHYPSDVIIGGMMGIIIGVVIIHFKTKVNIL